MLRAYTRLQGLQKRLDALEKRTSLVGESYVIEYHEALQHLEVSGFDIAEFRVKPEQVWKHRHYGRVVCRTLFSAKLDAVLGYFEVVATPPERPKPLLGFHHTFR